MLKQRQAIIDEKNTIETEKDAEIKLYRSHIDHLQSEFGAMLGDTLVKIKAKIEQANNQWKEENDAKVLKGYTEVSERGAGQN